MAIKDRYTGQSDVNSTSMPDNERWRITHLRDRLRDLWDSTVNRSTDAGVLFPVPKKVTGLNLLAGTNDVVHNAGHVARMVSVSDADGWQLQIQWRPKPGAEDTTIEVHTGEDVSNVTLNIIAWT